MPLIQVTTAASVVRQYRAISLIFNGPLDGSLTLRLLKSFEEMQPENRSVGGSIPPPGTMFSTQQASVVRFPNSRQGLRWGLRDYGDYGDSAQNIAPDRTVIPVR